jgi:hypothetical protein
MYTINETFEFVDSKRKFEGEEFFVQFSEKTKKKNLEQETESPQDCGLDE